MRIERIWQRSPQVQKTAQAETDAFPLSSRRGFLVGALSLIAAPALVRASSIMPVKSWVEPLVAQPVTSDLMPFSDDTTEFYRWLWDNLDRHLFEDLHHLPYEGRLPEVSRWKDTAGPGADCAYGAASFPSRSPAVVQSHQRELPMLNREGL